MAFDTIIFEVRDGVAYVTLNRPDKLNALNEALVQDLTEAASRVAADSAVRAVLLAGSGRGFCAGADLGGGRLFEPGARSLGETIGDSMRNHFNPMVRAWAGLGVPIVVAVNGVAAGAGVSLALLGDIVIAGRSANFIQLFAPKLGLMPDLGSTFFLPRLVGTARAKGLAMLGDTLSAADAERWGLIWACVDDAALAAEAERIARRFATGPTQAYRHIKAAFNREPCRTLPEQLDLEVESQAILADTSDFAEGLLAFREKRGPDFCGK